MVSTNSPQKLHFRAVDLLDSEFEEDKDLVVLARKSLEALVKSLLPVLKYVDKQIPGHDHHDVRGVKVLTENSYNLILSRTGKWFVSFEAGFAWRRHDDVWGEFYFDEVINGLERAFAEAEAKRVEHLATLKERRKILAKISDIINSS